MKGKKEDSSVLDVFRYEVFMYLYMYIRVTQSKFSITGLRNRARKNAYVESLLLHTRILAEILVIDDYNNKDDIKLNDFIEVEKISDKLNSLLKKLKRVYGKSQTKHTPRWRLNKMLFHASKERGISYNYSPVLIAMHELIILIIEEFSLLTNDIVLMKFLRFYRKSLENK